MTGNGSILVVDDELLNRKLLSVNLTQAGYDVSLAENGVQALEMVTVHPFDVVLLDLIMPEIDGYEVLSKIKANPDLRHIPVIVISASDDMESIVKCIEQGAADYLTKPFDPILLHARLKGSLAIKRLRDQEIARTRQMESQLRLAAQAQRSMLPANLPSIPGFEVAAQFEPAREVGGDFYDVVPLLHGQVALFLADVTDKGVHAALFMAVARTLFLQELHRNSDPLEVAWGVHQGLRGASSTAMFVTAIYGVLDSAASTFRWIRGGHEFPLLVHEDGRSAYLSGVGTALGIHLGQPKIEEQMVLLEPGDCLVFYSDGVTDMMNDDRERFGSDRLESIVQSKRHSSAAEIAQQIYHEVARHRNSFPAVDDFSLLVLQAK